MSITFPAAHAAKTKLLNVKEDWLIQLYYDAAGASDFIGLSEVNRIVSGVQYYGIIEEFGEISQSINLLESKASTAYVSMLCLNTFKNGTLSEVLYGGSNDYLRRKVKIYSCLNDESTLTNCALLFEGILISVNHTQEKVNLHIEQKTPWDFITIPQTKTNKGIYVPVVYGDYTAVDDDTAFSKPTNGTYHPLPVNRVFNQHIYCLNHQNETTQTALHVYEDGWDLFAPLTDDNGNAVEIETGIYALLADYDLDREFKARPPAINTSSTTFPLNGDDLENVIDDEGDATPSTYAYDIIDTVNFEFSGAVEDDYLESTVIYLEAPFQGLGYIDSITVGLHCYAEAEVDYASDISGYMTLSNTVTYIEQSYGSGTQIAQINYTSTSGSTGTTTMSKGDQTVAITSKYTSAKAMPNNFIIRMTTYAEYHGEDASDEANCKSLFRIYDIWYVIHSVLDIANEPDSCHKIWADLEKLYSASDGFTQGYTDGSGLATLPHEIHRDLMDRFADLDYDNDYMSGWSDLATARTGWTCRWWTLEPVSLREVLEQIQFEGCFIFLLTADSDGSGNPGGKYIWVKNSYSSGDVTHTLTESDYDNLKISTTDIKDLVTSTTYNYLRHPATDDYRSTRTYTNSTARTDWGISTNENKDSFDLDFITADQVYESGSDSNPNDCVALYYDNIKANPRVLVSFELKNIAKSNTELGDIIQISDSDIDPYGLTWSNLYFMVVEIRRGLGKLYIKGREVYSA